MNLDYAWFLSFNKRSLSFPIQCQLFSRRLGGNFPRKIDQFMNCSNKFIKPSSSHPTPPQVLLRIFNAQRKKIISSLPKMRELLRLITCYKCTNNQKIKNKCYILFNLNSIHTHSLHLEFKGGFQPNWHEREF